MRSCFYFVPARGGSKRFPSKNIAKLNGSPLICHTLRNIQASNSRAEIVVSTDDPSVRQAIEIEMPGSCIRFDARPEALGSDFASVSQVLREYLARARPTYDDCFCIYPTAVLVSAATISQAQARFAESTQFKTLMGASEYNLHPWQALYRSNDGFYVPFFREHYKKKAQELPHFFASNGSFYLVRTDEFRSCPDFYAAPLDIWKMSEDECVDINYPNDLEKVERILAWKQRK